MSPAWFSQAVIAPLKTVELDIFPYDRFMGQKKKDSVQWLARAVKRSRSPHVREPLTTSLELMTKIPGHVGELSGKAAGVLTQKDSRSVRRRLSITVVLLSLFAAFVAAVGNYYSLPHTPEDTAERYLSALKEGNYVSGLDRSAYSSFDHTYLSNSAYSAAEGRIEDFTLLGSTSTGGEYATVYAEVSVGGQQQNLSLPLKLATRTGPFNDLWEFSAPTYKALTLQAPVALNNLNINQTSVSLPASRRVKSETGFQWNIPLPPGDYSFSLPDNSYYRLVNPPTITAPLPGQGSNLQPVDLVLRPSPRMWEETNTIIESWLERCESARRLNVESCPTSETYGSDSTATITDVQWRLIDRPVFFLVQDDQRADTWRASRYRPATFEVTYLADGKAQRETINFYISAEVVSNGSHADISVGLGGSEESEAALLQAITSEDAAKSTLQKYAETL